MRDKFVYLIIPALVFMVSSILLGYAIYYGWLGPARDGIMLFCERARDAFVKQPANSYSNLGFSLVGLYMAWVLYQNGFPKDRVFLRNKLYPLTMSIVLILVGAGSFAMHATNAFWGGFCDLLAMFLTSAFVFCYGLKRLYGVSDKAVLIVYVVTVLVSSWVFVQSWNHFGFILSVSEFIVVFHILSSVYMELRLHFGQKYTSNFSWAVASAVTIIVAFIIWNLSRTQDSLWCNPDSLVQGHAFWHVLMALSLGFLFKYFISEVELSKEV